MRQLFAYLALLIAAHGAVRADDAPKRLKVFILAGQSESGKGVRLNFRLNQTKENKWVYRRCPPKNGGFPNGCFLDGTLENCLIVPELASFIERNRLTSVVPSPLQWLESP